MSQLQTREPQTLESAFLRVRQTTLEMLRIIDDPDKSVEERHRASRTIREALLQVESSEMSGVSLTRPAQASMREDLPDLESRLDFQEASFWRKVHEILKSKSITQSQLADQLGITQPAVSQMLNRRCRPQRSTIMSLATALSVEPTELWPDLEVSDLLDQVAAFQQEQPMTDSEAPAIQRTLKRDVPNVPARSLPKWKR
jgi:transcriptional regulator with XRE-family HTH domain